LYGLNFHINPWSNEKLRRILVGVSASNVFFLTIYWHFKAILQTQWVNLMGGGFTNVFLTFYVGFESFYSFNFFHLSKFRNRISPPNAFLEKFQHPFATLKHYNLAIYVVKWLQIWFTSSTTESSIHTLQDYTVEISIP